MGTAGSPHLLDSRGGNMATAGYLEWMQRPVSPGFKALHRDNLTALQIDTDEQWGVQSTL
ncbi:hypothetical protein Vi05172_g7587 [Venturia inaequalis]|nr:hypothetical protein Vi05172_g7587 [Venturia inaequalis]